VNKKQFTLLQGTCITFGPPCILWKNIVLVVCACADEGFLYITKKRKSLQYSTASHKTFTTKLRRYNQFRWKWSQAD